MLKRGDRELKNQEKECLFVHLRIAARLTEQVNIALIPI